MSVINEVLEWQDCAEQARQVAGQLTDPEAKQAMLQAAKGYEHLARTAAAARADPISRLESLRSTALKAGVAQSKRSG